MSELSTASIQTWLDRHRVAIAAGVNVGEIDRRKAQRFELELIRRRTA
ncbi:hypothetical protein [Mycolicibacter kumamotonensis]|nr:hypothetical protein [Mycolicibacter kumamotonensis]